MGKGKSIKYTKEYDLEKHILLNLKGHMTISQILKRIKVDQPLISWIIIKNYLNNLKSKGLVKKIEVGDKNKIQIWSK